MAQITTPGSLPNVPVPDPAKRPSEYVGVLVSAALGVVLALGVAVPAAALVSIPTFAVVLTTGVVAYLRQRHQRQT